MCEWLAHCYRNPLPRHRKDAVMPSPPNADRITGNTRHRAGLFGKLILQVEENYTGAYAGMGGANPIRITETRWRDARVSDLYLIQWHERQASREEDAMKPAQGTPA
jgi:hypothetical protein